MRLSTGRALGRHGGNRAVSLHLLGYYTTHHPRCQYFSKKISSKFAGDIYRFFTKELVILQRIWYNIPSGCFGKE
jgi:hypothetical protein